MCHKTGVPSAGCRPRLSCVLLQFAVVRPVRLILLLLLQWTDCSGLWSNAFPSSSLQITIPSVHDVIDAGDDDLVVVSDTVQPIGGHRITRIRGGAEEVLATIPRGRYVPGEALVRTGQDQWWFSATSGSASKETVAFVTADATGVRQTSIDVRPLSLLWVPIRGEKPGGIMLSFGADDRSKFLVDEITESGMRSLGSYPSHLPGTAPLPSFWSAERLPDGRIAMLSIERTIDSPWRFMLRLFDGNGGVAESPLPCADQFRESLTTQIDRNGKIAAVALTPKREVATTLIDVSAPQNTRCRVISPAGESTVLTGRGGTPAILVAGDDRIAAWIRDDGTLRACQIAKEPSIVDVADHVDTMLPLAHLVSADGSEMLTFTWNSDRGILVRRLPRALPGFALLTDIQRFYASLKQ